jgi:hypothetical protein
MAVPGVTRFRKWQVGAQSAFGTPVAATHVLPYRGVMVANPNWTDDDTDVGSIDEVMAPYRIGLDATATMAGRLNYNDLPDLYNAALKGGVTPTGATAKTWTYQVASLSQDPFGYTTGQFGDDVLSPTTDWVQGLDGVIEQLDFTGPDNMGPYDVSSQWRFSDVNGWGNHALSGTVPTAGLSVDNNPERVMLTDTELFIDSTAAGIGATKISDAVHSISISIAGAIDPKRFANGSNTRFAITNYSRGPRVITVTLRFAKADVAVLEAQNVYSTTAVNRYVEILTTSPTIITGSTHYSNSIRLPLRYRTREDTDLNNNAVITLVGRAFYDSTLTYAFKGEVVNTRAAL